MQSNLKTETKIISLDQCDLKRDSAKRILKPVTEIVEIERALMENPLLNSYVPKQRQLAPITITNTSSPLDKFVSMLASFLKRIVDRFFNKAEAALPTIKVKVPKKKSTNVWEDDEEEDLLALSLTKRFKK